MRIVFLDVDGVLNGYNKFTGVCYWFFTRLHLMKFVNKYYDLFGVRTRMVKRLAKIVRKTGAKVVISSSWRGGWYKPYEQKMDRQKALHDKLHKYKIEVVGITDKVELGKYHSHRESEIRKWLSEHPEVTSFVILDDEQFDLQGFVGKELIQTCKVKEVKGCWYEGTGLKRRHIKQAIKILNGEVSDR